jgi:hypothetical protein
LVDGPEWVNNGYGDRSTGRSVVPQIADDFGARRKSAEVGQKPPFGVPFGCTGIDVKCNLSCQRDVPESCEFNGSVSAHGGQFHTSSARTREDCV